MARLLKEVKPSEKTYKIELTQSEIDFITGLCADLSDNRNVGMVYIADESFVKTTKLGEKKARDIAEALAPTQDISNYDYFDYWAEQKPIDWVPFNG